MALMVLRLRFLARPACTRERRARGSEVDPAAAERGQAAVELVAAIPLVVLVGLVAWQLALAGHTAWLCAHAARAAARADTVGRSAAEAARSALPDSMERSLEVERLSGGGVRVTLGVPLVRRRWGSPITVAAVSSLGRATP